MQCVTTKSRQRSKFVLTAAALAALSSATTWAGDMYWDNNGTTTGVGSNNNNGNWLAAAKWSTTTAGTNAANWIPGSDAIFFENGTTPTPGNVTIAAAGASASSLTFLETGTTGYTVTGAGTLTLSGANTITLGGSGYSNNMTDAIENVVSASSLITFRRLTSNTASTLNLKGLNSTYSAGVRVADTLHINLNATNALGSGNTVTVVSSQSTFSTAAGGVGPAADVSVGSNFALNPNNESGFLTAFGSAKLAQAVTYAGSISGSSDVVICTNGTTTNSNGIAVVVFSGTNTYTGATIINSEAAGVFRLNSAGALPTGTALVFGRAGTNGVSNNGVLDLNGQNISISSLATNLASGKTALGITNTNGGSGGTIDITGSATTTYDSTIGANATNANVSGASNNLALHLTSAHSGSLTLPVVNTYTGNTTIDGGTLVAAHIATTGNTISGPVIVNSTGTLVSAANTTNGVHLGSSLTANNGSTVTVGGAGTVGTLFAGSLSANGTTDLKLDILSTTAYDKLNLTGAATLDTGTHTIDVAAANGGTALPGTYTVLTFGSTNIDGTHLFTLGTTPGIFSYALNQTSGTDVKLEVTAATTFMRWDADGGGPAITEGAGTWQDGTTTFVNLQTNTQRNFENDDNFDVMIGGTSDQAGGLITLGGDVRIGGKLYLPAVSAPYTIGNGGSNTVTFAGGISALNSTTIDAPVVLQGSQTWTVATGSSLTLTANATVAETGGSAALTKDGDGTLILGAAGSFGGGVNITAGTLAVANGSAAGSGAIAISNNATLRTSASVTVTNPISVASTGAILSVDTTLNSALSGNITGSGAVTKAGGGTLELTGTNTFNGLSIATGTLVAGSDSALGSGAFSVGNSSIFRPSASFSTAKAITLIGTGGVTGRFDVPTGVILTLSGNITGGAALAKEGVGTLVLSGNNSGMTGQPQFPATTGGGVIVTTSTNALGAQNLIMLANGTLRTTVNDLTIKAVRGTSILTKEGATKLIVNDTSTSNNFNAGASIVVNEGIVQMDSHTGLGGYNGSPLTTTQMPITLNTGTELIVNWASTAESRYSRNITLNDATLTRQANAGSSILATSEFTTYAPTGTPTNDLGGVLTIGSGNSAIRNQENPSTAGAAKQLQFQMPAVVSTGGTLTLSAAASNGDYQNYRTVLRGVTNATISPFLNDALTMQAGSTLIASGTGEKGLGSNDAGKPIIGLGTTGSDATLKFDSHTFLTDSPTSANANITRLVVAGSGSGGLRVEAPMNASYTAPTGAAPAMRTYDGTTGLLGANTTTTKDGVGMPSGYAVIGNAFSVLSNKRLNQLSSSFGSPAVTLGGTLTVAATDSSTPAPGRISTGPDSAVAVRLALDNTAASAGANLVYEIDGSADSGKFGNFAGLDVKRSNAGAGSVKAKLVNSTTRTPDVSVSGGGQIDINDRKLILTNMSEGTWNGSAYDGVLGMVRAGRNSSNANAPWNGGGIVTSQTDATGSNFLTSVAIATADELQKVNQTWGGYTLDTGDVLAMYTYGGDSNLSGNIDGDDFTNIDAGFSGNATGYFNGDFNYSGNIDADDYFIIDANYGKQTLGNIPAAPPLGGVTAVPEPTSLAAFLLAGGCLLARRRRAYAIAGFMRATE